MSGYDSAELNSTDPGLKNAAHVAKDVLAEKINGKIVDVYCGKFDKYGRLLVVVYYGGQNINDWMIEHGYGTVYDGRGAKYGAVKVPPAK
jgi:endonuclease YncB( thermonuclease family)